MRVEALEHEVSIGQVQQIGAAEYTARAGRTIGDPKCDNAGQVTGANLICCVASGSGPRATSRSPQPEPIATEVQELHPSGVSRPDDGDVYLRPDRVSTTAVVPQRTRRP